MGGPIQVQRHGAPIGVEDFGEVEIAYSPDACGGYQHQQQTRPLTVSVGHRPNVLLSRRCIARRRVRSHGSGRAAVLV